RKIIPLEAHGLKVMAIGFFMGSEDAAVVWRGPMLHKALTQFLEDVDWGELDYLLIDLPPGTGDVSMTLAQLLPQAKFVIVTTPQPTAQKVARRAAEMAHKVNLEIAGVIENMAGFVTPGGERFAIFGEGGGQPGHRARGAGGDRADPRRAAGHGARGRPADAAGHAAQAGGHVAADGVVGDRLRRSPTRSSPRTRAPARTGARARAAGGGRSARSGWAAPT